MSSAENTAIRVRGLSKMFKIYSRPADMFWELWTGKSRFKPFWALKDVSFDVQCGQVVGILGRNGAGKSTLLKVITGTLDHTEGSVSVSGRVSSILELGTGFHGEYSGRENIYLGGLMVGLTREEILHKMDWIIQFSELEDFIDQPFKTYSTGMQARLTFSTAVCIDPDILIIDEALSVGDARFQRKSFGKMEEFRKAGHTILLVSHDTNTINSFCDYAIMLEHGMVFDHGEPERISKVYYQKLFSTESAAIQPASEPVGEQAEAAISEIELDRAQICREAGYAWRVDLSHLPIRGDSTGNPEGSRYVLLEDGRVLRPAHYAHDLIRKHGKGGYSHWDDALYFSTSDNSDPTANGRIYSLRHEGACQPAGPEPQTAEAGGREWLRRRALRSLDLSGSPASTSSRLTRMGNGKAEILDSGIRDDEGRRTVTLVSGQRYTFFMRVLYYEDVEGTTFGFVIRDGKGVDMFGTSSRVQQLPVRPQKRGDFVEVSMGVTMWLTNGIYFLTFAAADPFAEQDVQYDLQYDGLQFEIGNSKGLFTTSVVNLDMHCIQERALDVRD